MKTINTIILLLVFTVSVQAQSFELIPKHDTQTTNFYMQANENSVSAGFQFLGITSGVTQEQRFGEEILYIDARITPTLARYNNLELIGGVGGSTGYSYDSQIMKSRWNAIAGLRFKSVEVTFNQFYHYGDDYSALSARWYLD